VKVAGRWRYVDRAVDQFGQVIDVLVARRRDANAARRCFQRAIGTTKVTPAEVTTDTAPIYPAVLEELLPAAWHRIDRYANHRVECGHARLKARLRPMRGLKQDRSARVVMVGTGSSSTFDADTMSWPRTRRRIGGGGRVRPAHLGDLTAGRRRDFSMPWVGATQQRRHLRPRQGGT
jgi:transposase-like protein